MYYALIDLNQMIIHFVEDNNAYGKTFNCKENIIQFLSLEKDGNIKASRNYIVFGICLA